MRVLMVSKACVVGQYQTKLEALAHHRDIDLTVVVPPFWKDERGIVPLERLHTDGYNLLVEPIHFNGNFHLYHFPTLPKVLRNFRPDIVHIDEEPYNLSTFLAFIAVRRSGLRALFFTWQNILRRYPPPFSFMEKYVYRRSVHAIAGNKDAVLVLRSKGYRGACTTIPQFGIDPRQFAPVERARHSTIFRIGFVGRLVEEKGPLILLQAVANLEGNWQIRFIGSGPLRAEMIALARSRGIESRISFTNWMPSSEIPEAYRDLDLLVIPSLTRSNWKEQFGRVAVEAMASGVPVLASLSGELPNVIGSAGVLVPENDPAALANGIRRLYDDSDLRGRLRESGRTRVLENYTQQRVADDTRQVYLKALTDA